MNNIYIILEKKLGSKVKEYRDKWNKAGKDGYIPDYPLHLNFELTFGCNLKCDFCIHSIPLSEWSYKVDPAKQISFEKYKEIIDEGVKKGLCSIEFNGINEPLLKNDISRYIRYAVDSGVMVTSLHTNAVSLKKEMIKNIFNSGLILIIFSVDAIFKKTYEGIRENGNYNEVIKNINYFLKFKKKYKKDFPLVQMSFARNKFNYKELNKYKEYWKNKVDIISVSSFCNPFIDTKKEIKIENKYRMENFIIDFCKEPYQRLLIRHDGYVHPCCSFFGGEYIVGNIYDESISKIWNNEKINNIRKNIINKTNNISICNKCKKSMIHVKI